MTRKRGNYNFPLLRAATAVLVPTKETKKLTIALGDASVSLAVPQDTVVQVAKLREGGISAGDIVTTVAQGEWAHPLAKAFCLPEERFRLPENMLSAEEHACIDTVSLRLAKELLGAG